MEIERAFRPVRWPLRRTAVRVHATYGDTFSNNLRGENFACEVAGQSITLDIDLSPNLRTRNKGENSYLDAVELARDHEQLKFIQLSDRQVLDGLARALGRASDADLRLRLHFGQLGTFLYRVQAQDMAGGGAQFTVLEALPTTARSPSRQPSPSASR